jgi:hypothetical protein
MASGTVQYVVVGVEGDSRDELVSEGVAQLMTEMLAWLADLMMVAVG